MKSCKLGYLGLTISPSTSKQPFRSLPKKWEEQYVIYTKDPIREIWNSLQHFNSYEYLKKFLNDRLNNIEIKQMTQNNLDEDSHIGMLTNTKFTEKFPYYKI